MVTMEVMMMIVIVMVIVVNGDGGSCDGDDGNDDGVCHGMYVKSGEEKMVMENGCWMRRMVVMVTMMGFVMECMSRVVKKRWLWRMVVG